MNPEERILVEAADAVRARAHAPYSRLRVGAAVRDASGTVWVGTNVENVSYGLTICAERAALFAAVAGGAVDIREVAVVTERAYPPCGACRQVILELAPKASILIASPDRVHRRVDAADLLPAPFDGFGADTNDADAERDR